MTSGISAVLALSLMAMTSLAFNMMEIVPGRKVAAQIGKELVLSCRTSGCAVAPTFLWRAQLDFPLGGTVHQEGSNSFLTMKHVTFESAHEYICSATCGDEKKQKRVQVDVYSFPEDPIIEISSPLILGKQAEVTCSIPNVYPSDRLEMSLKIGEKLIGKRDFFDDPDTQFLQTKSLRMLFTPTEGDIGKDVTCIAELPIHDMKFEPKERQSTRKLDISVFSSTLPSTVSSLIIQPSTVLSSTIQPSTIPPSTESSSTVLSSTIQPSTIPPSTESSSTIPPSTISSSTIPPSTISSSTILPSTISTSSYQPEHTTEMEDFTIHSTPNQQTDDKKIKQENEASTAAKDTNVMLYGTLKNEIQYAASMADDITNDTEEILVIARREELDSITTAVIVVASLATVAGPMIAILLYICRKAKINGSYSLVNSPEQKV